MPSQPSPDGSPARATRGRAAHPARAPAPPGPQHFSGSRSLFLRLARVVGLVALAAVLVTIPLVWARSAAPAGQALADTGDPVPSSAGRQPAPAVATSTAPTSAATTAPTATVTATPVPPVATAPAVAPPPAAAPAPAPVAAPAPAPAPAKPAAPAPAAPQTSLTDQIVVLTNAERAKGGLAPLAVSTCLTDQSNRRTAVLVAQDRFEHDPLDPVIAACGMPHAIGENLILGYPDAASAVQGWMGSPGHRANIMNPAFTQIGVGCTLGPKGQLCGQLFLG